MSSSPSSRTSSPEVLLPFQRIFVDAQPTTPRPGDRFIYDRRNGTLQVHREAGDIFFVTMDDAPRERFCFVGRDWSEEMTAECAALYARLGGLRGEVLRIDGSFPSLVTFEVLG